MTARCPDCSATSRLPDKTLTHDQTCPLGWALDAVTNDDRDWFAAHPWAPVRHRPIAAVERDEHLMFGLWEVAHCTRVQVIEVKPGVRVRHPYGGGARAHSAADVERIRARFATPNGGGDK